MIVTQRPLNQCFLHEPDGWAKVKGQKSYIYSKTNNVKLLISYNFPFCSMGSYLPYHETLSFSFGGLLCNSPFNLVHHHHLQKISVLMVMITWAAVKKKISLKAHVTFIFGQLVYENTKTWPHAFEVF